MQPYRHANNLHTVLDKVFKKWVFPLSGKPFTSFKNTNDFGVQINELLISSKINERKVNPIKSSLARKTIYDGLTFQHIPTNMEALSKQLGIALYPTSEFYFVRDHFFRLRDGSIKITKFSGHAETAIMRTHSSNLYLNRTAATRTKNQLFNSWIGYTQSQTSKIQKDIENLFRNHPQTFSYAYVEGGNVWMITNEQGESVLLIGADHLIQTLHILDLDETQSWGHLCHISLQKSFEILKKEITDSLTTHQIQETAEQMYAEGLLLQLERSGLIDRKSQLDIMLMKFMIGPNIINQSEENWFRTLAVQLNLIYPFELTEASADTYRSLVAEYLAKKAITHGLIALDFEVNPKNLHFISQVNYHLDTFLRPGPNHTIFLMNFALWIDLLKSLVDASETLGLSDNDKEHLLIFLETSQKFEIELGPFLKEVEEQLQKAGFTVIPTPGHLLYETKTMYREFPMPSEGFNVNFINSLTGWSPETGKYYYITHGISCGEKVGSLIMDAFSLFLQQYIPDIEVYYVGQDPDHLNDFSEAMDWWNRLETQSGIHCMTLELETETH